MDQLYTDFTTKLLPKIQEGIQITKEYFIDLFGRYVRYLIITDIIWASITFLIMIGGIILIRKALKSKETQKFSDGWGDTKLLIFFIGIIPLIVGFITTIMYVNNIVKDFYIPEIRIIQEIKSYSSDK